MNNASQLRKRSTKENIPVSPLHELNEHKHSQPTSLILSSRPIGHSTVNQRPILATTSSMTSPSTSSASEHRAFSQHYLRSPLDTLAESLDDPLAERITLHDLVETYSVVCARLKLNVLAGQDTEQVFLATNCFKQRASQLVDVLRRDVTRALIDPCLSEQGLQAPDGAIHEDEIQHARDLAMVNHHALRLLSDIMSFPSLISSFSGKELTVLLEGILTILMEPSLPTPHSGRTYSLALWTLQVQRLPAEIVLSHKDSIVATVKRAISGQFKKTNAVIDGLKIIANLLREHAREFLTSFRDLLPNVLPFLVAESPDIRLGAAHALSAFAYAKLETPIEKDQHYLHFSDVVHQFLSAHFLVADVSPSKPTLLTILRGAVKMSNQPTHRGDGPQWAAVVISSLIIVFDFCLYDAPKMLRIFMNKLISEFSRHRRDTVQLLHAPVWKSLVWVFSRMPRGPSFGSSDERDVKRSKAFHVLRQELDSGIAVALSATVLKNSPGVVSRDDTSVSEVLKMISSMAIAGKESLREVGLSLLARLTSSIGNSSSPTSTTKTNAAFLDIEFFDGRLLETKPELLAFSVESMHRIDTGIVRQLTEEEIITHWDKMLEIWIKIVLLALETTEPKFPNSIFHIWQVLLLVQSQLTQNNGHLTASTSFTHRVATICANFAAIQRGSGVEVKHIHLLRDLWHTVKSVFVDACLEEPAMTLLNAIVERDFRIADAVVYSAWNALCQDVIRPLSKDETGTSAVDMKVWVAVARKWVVIGKELCWSNLIAFLEAPFPEHLASDVELSLWEELFRKVLLILKSSGEGESQRNELWQRFVPQNEDRLSLFPKQLFVVITALDIPLGPPLPSKTLFLLRKTLCALYPPQLELLDKALRYIKFIEEIIVTAPLELLVSFLAILNDGLCYWLKDQSKAIPDTEYNSTVVPFYCSTLDRLAMLEPTEEALLILWRFFVFPLSRCPAPGLAPRAFEKFWRATYFRREEFHSAYPDDLVATLLAYDKVFGTGLAAAFSQTDESQRTTSSLVPESVCSTQARRGKQTIPQRLEPVQEMSSSILDAIEQFQDVPNHSPSSPIVAVGRPSLDSPQQSFPPHFGAHHDQGPVRQSTRERVQNLSEAQSAPQASGDSSTRKRKRTTQEPEEHSVAKSPVQEASRASSRSSKRRFFMDSVEIPRAGPSKLSHESQLMTPEPSRLSSMGASSPAPISPQEDYGTWEEVVSSSGMRQLTRGLGAADADSSPVAGSEISDHLEDIVGSPSLRVTTKRRRTEPDLDASRDGPKAPSLRRSRTNSVALIDLQRVLSAYKDDGFDAPTEDLLKASKLVHQFGSALSEEIARRLNSLRP